jgi:hypothetical protein
MIEREKERMIDTHTHTDGQIHIDGKEKDRKRNEVIEREWGNFASILKLFNFLRFAQEWTRKPL